DKKRIDSYANITEIPITLSASSWTGTEAPYTQTVAVSELQSYNSCSVEIHPDAASEQENALLESEINITAYSETSGLSFSAASKPSVDIPILLCAGASMNVVNVPNYIGETPVTGIKGSAEASFRQGQVNLTPEHLGALPADGDSQNNTVTFPTAETQNSWTDVADLASGEKHNSLFHKLSTMMKNVRYLYGLLGTANITSIGNGTVTGALSKLNTDLLERVYPVGAIYMSVNSANPGTLFGGTWEAWGIGRVPVGVNTGEGNFNAVEKAGGASSVSYTPVGTVGYHTLTTAEIPSHAHSVGAHSHGLNNHTHTIGAHSHGLNNHTHNFSASTNSITLSGNLWNFAVQSDTSGISTSGIISKNNVNGGAVGYATVRKTGNSTTYTDTVNINASHGHSLSGTTNAAAGSTANSAVFYSGAASGSTANSTAFNSGPNGSGNSHNHGFTGTAGSISTIQPYITCYMWKRIA
ncbi:MAG: hypothetical protein HFH48_10135, partial [Lachnospiraceae bacterium]|nr:hypothetical protein [Lachnospiraceae bacterium]